MDDFPKRATRAHLRRVICVVGGEAVEEVQSKSWGPFLEIPGNPPRVGVIQGQSSQNSDRHCMLKGCIVRSSRARRVFSSISPGSIRGYRIRTLGQGWCGSR